MVNPPAAHPLKPAWGELYPPPQLSADEIVLAKRYLGRLSPGQHQDVLDVPLQARLDSVQSIEKEVLAGTRRAHHEL